MKLNQPLQTAFRLLLILSLSGLMACSAKEDAKPDTTAGGSIVGLNYTGEGIQWFLVDGAGGGGVSRYGISGGPFSRIHRAADITADAITANASSASAIHQKPLYAFTCVVEPHNRATSCSIGFGIFFCATGYQSA